MTTVLAAVGGVLLFLLKVLGILLLARGNPGGKEKWHETL